MGYRDDEYGCLCSGRDDYNDRCAGCGSRDISGTIGGDAFCGPCWDAEQEEKKKNRAKRAERELAANRAEVDKLLASPCKVDPRGG